MIAPTTSLSSSYLLLHFELKVTILQNRTRLCRQQSTLGRRVLRFEGVADRLHGHPFDAFEFVDVFDVAVVQERQYNSLLLIGREYLDLGLTALTSSTREGGRKRLGVRSQGTRSLLRSRGRRT